MGPHIASLLAWGTLPPLHHCPLTEVPDNGTTSRNWGCRGWNPRERVPRVRGSTLGRVQGGAPANPSIKHEASISKTLRYISITEA